MEIKTFWRLENISGKCRNKFKPEISNHFQTIIGFLISRIFKFFYVCKLSEVNLR